MFGAFPKILREYVRERKIYTLEEAIRRMTSQPAARMRLEGRGVLKPGNWADILIFDPEEFRDQATYLEPARPSTGLSFCLVNGEIAVDHGQWVMSTRSGQNLRVKNEKGCK